MALVNQNDRDIYYTNVEGDRTRPDRTAPSQGTPPRGQSTPSAGTDDPVFGDTAHGGVRDQRDATPETDTHSLDPSELTTNNMETFVHAMTHPMPYGQPDKQGSIPGLGAGPLEHDEIMDMYNSMTDTFAEHPEWGDLESFGEDKFMALAMVAANGGMGEDFDLESYMGMSEADRDTALANGIANWIDDPQASGKETLTANIGVESMLGTQGGVRDILNIQSIDVLFGYEDDIHANTFFDQNLKADTLLAMDQILENLQEQGEITEDQYFDACASYDARMMNMAWCGNASPRRTPCVPTGTRIIPTWSRTTCCAIFAAICRPTMSRAPRSTNPGIPTSTSSRSITRT